jgi:hypothetical protein
VRRQHKQKLESHLGCAVTEPAPTGTAQPESSGQPKGWYSESKEEGVSVFGFVGYRSVWVCRLSGYRKQIGKKFTEKRIRKTGLIPC